MGVHAFRERVRETQTSESTDAKKTQNTLVYVFRVFCGFWCLEVGGCSGHIGILFALFLRKKEKGPYERRNKSKNKG